MAATVTWEGLRDLAAFRASNGCAISLYLDLDPSVSPTAGDAASRVNALVDEIVRSEAANRAELTHEQKQGLRADAARLSAFFAEEFSREGSRGYAVFCAGLDNVWQPLALSERVPDLVRVGRAFYLAPLVPLVGRGEGALVAVVGRERAELYRLRAGRLEELVEQFDEQHGRHDQGGWSQARYQRHIEKLVHDHLREIAELVERWTRRRRGPSSRKPRRTKCARRSSAGRPPRRTPGLRSSCRRSSRCWPAGVRSRRPRRADGWAGGG